MVPREIRPGGKGFGLSSHRAEELWQQKEGGERPPAAIFSPPSHFERKDEKELRERRAKSICTTCPVQTPCLDYALQIREPHGVWGGRKELERKQLVAR